jgi:uncharacterized protein (UPF0248 family)
MRFFDDDILYDSQAAGFSEDNTQIKDRILTNTPSLKPQTTLTGIESKYFNQSTTEDDNVLIYPIGTNSLTSKKANGWEITALLGEFSSSLNYMSSSTAPFSPAFEKVRGTISPLYNIPQIECEMDFVLSIGSLNHDEYDSDDYEVSGFAEDGTFVKLKHDDLLLHILEKNGFSYKDSLSLEVFEYEPDEVIFNKLQFKYSDQNQDNKIEILERNEVEGLSDLSEMLENSVENYFYIETDSEISIREICKGTQKLKNKNIYLGLDFNCDDFFDEEQEINIYQTLVDEEDIEDCEA